MKDRFVVKIHHFVNETNMARNIKAYSVCMGKIRNPMSFSHNCKLKIPCKRFFCLNFSDVAGFLAGLVKRAIAFLISHTCTFFFAAVFDRIFQTKEAKLQSVIIPFLDRKSVV